jgi:hypothetical protein
MTKKDYELIAEVLREYVWYGYECRDVVTMIINDLSDVFASENERFDNNKFLEACIP